VCVCVCVCVAYVVEVYTPRGHIGSQATWLFGIAARLQETLRGAQRYTRRRVAVRGVGGHGGQAGAHRYR
jgi:hypothetical protein